ncbi:G-protein coupled receptor 4-like [Micropterus salmoides]|uniref:G-protein coupled receptor 4-like n=1 Tax=Micropterus salmoides TaxID=27706 RepID=UPI0018EB5525|nr:G-protein coupled receptor 4-like [Micropterus salmoides]
MEDYYINNTSQDQSYNYSNITTDYYNSNFNTTQYYKEVPFIMQVLTYIIIAIGLPLSLMAIYALYYMVQSDQVAPIFVINLLISDLLQFCYMIVEVSEPEHKAIQMVSGLFYFFGLFASVGFMVCIALERYLVIVHPLWYRFRRTIKTSVALCAVVWVQPFVFIFAFSFIDQAQMAIVIYLLLPFPLLIFFLVGTFKALSASISVSSDEKRRIVGILVLVLLIYTLLFLPIILNFLKLCIYNMYDIYEDILTTLSLIFVRFSPLADLVLYVFMRKGTVDKLLASVCCCRMDSNDISSPSV